MQKYFQFLNLSFLLPLALMMSISITGVSQSDLFKPVQKDQSTFTERVSQQFKYYDALNPDHKPVFIEIGNLAKSQDDGKITLSLDDSACGEVTFVMQGAEYESETNYFWSGRIQGDTGDECSFGEMNITKTRNLLYGTITIGTESYSIEPFDKEGSHLLMKAPKGEVFTCGNTGNEIAPKIIPEFNERVLPDCDIQVLVLGTQSTFDSFTDFPAWADGLVNTMNQALLNSQINPGAAKFVIVATESTDGYFTEAGLTSNQAHSAIASNATAIARRNANNADVVLTFVNPAIMANDNVAGVAFLGGRWATIDRTVFSPSVRTNHEMGHLLRGNHERCGLTGSSTNCSSAGGAAHAHFGTTLNWGPFTFPYTWRTGIYGSAIVDGTLNQFSNPNTTLLQTPLGIAGVADNASVMRPYGCTAANWNTAGNETLTVTINGPSTPCIDSPTSGYYSAQVSGTNAGTLSYSWAISTNGVNYTPLFGSNSSIFVTFPSGPTFFILRCTVVSSNLGTYTSYKYINLINCGPGGPFTPDPGSGNDVPGADIAADVITYPNPSNGEITFRINAAMTYGKATIRILDQSGKFIRNIQIAQLDKGANVITENLSDLDNGTYHYTIDLGDRQDQGSFVIIKN